MVTISDLLGGRFIAPMRVMYFHKCFTPLSTDNLKVVLHVILECTTLLLSDQAWLGKDWVCGGE